MSSPTCQRTDCLHHARYSDCYIIGTEYCKFYHAGRKQPEVQEDVGLPLRIQQLQEVQNEAR